MSVPVGRGGNWSSGRNNDIGSSWGVDGISGGDWRSRGNDGVSSLLNPGRGWLLNSPSGWLLNGSPGCGLLDGRRPNGSRLGGVVNLVDLLFGLDSSNVGLGRVDDWRGGVHSGHVGPRSVGPSRTVGRWPGSNGLLWSNDGNGGRLLDRVGRGDGGSDVRNDGSDDSYSLVFSNRVSKVSPDSVRLDDGGVMSWNVGEDGVGASSGQKGDENDGL